MDSENKRVILVSYHFGDSGTTGGFRWAAMVRDLAALGWKVDVITATKSATSYSSASVTVVESAKWPSHLSNTIVKCFRALKGILSSSSSPSQNESKTEVRSATKEELLSRAESIAIWRIGDRLSRKQILSKSYDASIILAESLDWAFRAKNAAVRLMETNSYVAVLVSTPPHATQVAGRLISRKGKIPYVADYRDPWATGVDELNGYDSLVTQIIGPVLEKWTQESASVVIHNSELSYERARTQGRLPSVQRVCIPNGYDSTATDVLPDPDFFRIVYSGWIHPYMDVRILFRAIEQFSLQNREAASRIRIDLIGTPPDILGMPMRDMVKAYGLEDCVNISDRVTRDEAMSYQEKAALLVAFDCPHPLAIPMKFYDYLLMRGDMLLVSPRGSSLDLAANRIGLRTIDPGDSEGILMCIQSAYDRWTRRDYSEIKDEARIFSRSNRSREVHDVLLGLCV